MYISDFCILKNDRMMPFVLVHKHRKSTILSYVQSIYRWEIGVVIPNSLQHYCSVVEAKAAKAGVYLCEPHKPGGGESCFQCCGQDLFLKILETKTKTLAK